MWDEHRVMVVEMACKVEPETCGWLTPEPSAGFFGLGKELVDGLRDELLVENQEP